MGSASTVALTDLTWPWRWSHLAQVGELLSSGFKSDFTLLLGPDKEKVPVHKIFLQFVSPVLNSRVGKCSAAQLEINDVDPVIFKLLLKYIYTGDSGMTIVEALPLLKMATDFEVVPLADQCAVLLKSDITLENVLPLFQGAMEYAHGELIQSTLAFICKNGQKVVKLDDFVNLRLECLIEIIQQDELQVLDEMDVFNAVHRWGEAELSRSSRSVEMRAILLKALTHVRFPLMDATEFALNVATKNVLDMSELTSLLTCFHIPQEQRSILPQGQFPSTPRAYIELTEDLILSRGRENRPWARIKMPAAATDCLMIRCDTKVALKGFTIPLAIFTPLFCWDGSYQQHQFHTDLLHLDVSVTSGNNVRIQNCPPLGNLVNGRYHVNMDPPINLASRSQPTYLTVKFSGLFGIKKSGGYARQNLTFDATGMMISNYEDDFAKENLVEGSGIGLVIQRKAGDCLPMTQGFIEKLIFGPI